MTERKTPVFVWRSSAKTTSQGAHCRHCNFYILNASPTDFDDEKKKHREAFSKAASKFSNDPYWDKFMNTGTEGAFEWHPYELLCSRCGWWASGVTSHNGEQFSRVIESVLQDFDINDGQLAIDELVSHVSKSFDDVYSLSPRKFEELVANVYSNLGWQVEMTKQSRDGGIDLMDLSRINSASSSRLS